MASAQEKPNSENLFGILRWLLALLFLYALTTSLWVTWKLALPLRLPTFCYLFLLSGGAALALHTAFKQPALKKKHVDWNLAATALIGVTIWWIIRRPLIASRSIWLDEGLQFFTHNPGLIDPALGAAQQEQPPLDFYFSSFSRLAFGISEWSMWIHAIVFGILGFLLFVAFLNRIRLAWWLCPLPLLLYSAQNILARSSAEARPIALALFEGMLIFIFLLERSRSSLRNLISLFLSSLLLLLSVGLQPFFFLPLATLSFSVGRPFWEKWRLLCATTFLPSILFIPTLLELYQAAQKDNQFYDQSFWLLWKNGIRNLTAESFNPFFSIFEPANWVWILVGALALAYATKRKLRPLFWGTIAFITIWPILFLIFWSIINWPIYPRYFALWILGCVVFLSLLMAESTRFWRSLGFAMALSPALLFYSGYIPKQTKLARNFQSTFADWRKIISYAGPSEKNLFVLVPFSDSDKPNVNIVAGQVYESPNINIASIWTNKITSFGENGFKIALFNPSGFKQKKILGDYEEDRQVFFLLYILPESFGQEYEEFHKLLWASKYQLTDLGNNYFLAKEPEEKNPHQATVAFFRFLWEISPRHRFNIPTLNALISDDLARHKTQTAREDIGRLLSVRGANSPPQALKELLQSLRPTSRKSSSDISID